uniref:Ig-like domain-containing protein n=1 Tax=Astyanax mexicanus TaxID=7994 RepID=A0A3B1IUY3_ASTMX
CLQLQHRSSPGQPGFWAVCHLLLNTVQSSCPMCRKTPQNIMLPPPCFTVGMMFLGWYSSFFVLQTRRVELRPKISHEWNFNGDLSSDKNLNVINIYTLFILLAPPAVRVFAKKSVHEWRNLTLTCLITGFYPKDVKMSLRKFSTEIPEHLITSSGVRPNDDETYQLRKCVEIQEDDKADYDCYVSHSSLTEPVIKQWDTQRVHCIVACGLNIFFYLVLIREI